MKNKEKNNESSELNLNISNQNSLMSRKVPHFKKGFLKTLGSIINEQHHTKRKSNSLEILAKKFVQYIYLQKTDIINLKTLSKNINVHKRRIYDITNVLEGKIIIFICFCIGIGLIKKVKNCQILLKPEFYDLLDNYLNTILELNEEERESKRKKQKYKSKIRKIENEINKVNCLMENIDKKLLNKGTGKEEEVQIKVDHKPFLIKKEIKTKNSNYIGKKSKRDINLNLDIINGSLKETGQKECNMNEKDYANNGNGISTYFCLNKTLSLSKKVECDEEEKKEKSEVKIDDCESYFYNGYINNINNEIDFLINNNIDKKGNNMFSL